MNDIVMGHVQVCCAIYLDDVLIYCSDMDTRVKYVAAVLSPLKANKLCPKMPKCRFAQQRVDHLGYSIGADGIGPRKDKVADIESWPEQLNSLSDVLQFLGLVGFVRMLMRTRFADTALPLVEFTKKNIPFSCGLEHTKGVRKFKARLIHYTELQLLTPERPYVSWTDASGYSLRAVLL